MEEGEIDDGEKLDDVFVNELLVNLSFLLMEVTRLSDLVINLCKEANGKISRAELNDFIDSNYCMSSSELCLYKQSIDLAFRQRCCITLIETAITDEEIIGSLLQSENVLDFVKRKATELGLHYNNI